MKTDTIIQLGVLGLMFLVGQFGILYIFPILPDITHDFFPELSESELGFRQGYLAGIYFLGNFCSSIFWGKLSDKIGRKKAAILSTFLYSIVIGLFGLSVSYAMALILRFLWGLLNGIDPIIKTTIPEVCDNKKDLARGISLIGVTEGIGRMIGPTVSAWLSKPTTKFSFLKHNDFLHKYPYFLPSIVCTSLGMLSVIVASVLLKETVRKTVVPSDEETKQLKVIEDENDSQSEEERGDEEREDLTNRTRSKKGKNGRQNSCCNLLKSLRIILKLLTQRMVFAAIFNYNFLAFIMIQFDELIPLMMVTSPWNGGFCMNETSLGFITFCTSILQLLFVVLIIPVIINYLGIRKSLRIFLIVTAILMFCLPLWSRNHWAESSIANTMLYGTNAGETITLTMPFNGTLSTVNVNVTEFELLVNNSVEWNLANCNATSLGIRDIAPMVWLMFFSIQIPISLFRILIFVCCVMAVANSTSREFRASVNGVSQSGAAMVRMIGPVIGANLYAWSISLGYKWPIDATLIWSLSSILLVILFFTSFLFPPEIEKPQD